PLVTSFKFSCSCGILLKIIKKIIVLQGESMKKNEKKEYKKPEITEHENLNEVTKGEVTPPSSEPQ
ncbi:unnamed protein product, partial [marine sediment metagenome]